MTIDILPILSILKHVPLFERLRPIIGALAYIPQPVPDRNRTHLGRAQLSARHFVDVENAKASCFREFRADAQYGRLRFTGSRLFSALGRCHKGLSSASDVRQRQGRDCAGAWEE